MKNKEKKALELARKTPESNPFGMMRRFTEDMERMFEDFGGFRFPNFFNQKLFPFAGEEKEFDWMPRTRCSKPTVT